MKKIFLTAILLTLFFQGKGQIELKSQAGTVIANDQTPFLLRSNQYGLVSLNPNYFYLNSSLVKPYDSTGNELFDFSFGIEPQINIDKNTEFFLPVAYVQGRMGSFDLYIGRKREIQGFVDTVGTMGSFIWSGNALPVPKIDIGFRDFVHITPNGILSVKGNIAHGWLGDGDSVKNVLLHQKSFYIRLGKPDWNIQLIAGINHQAQWGGNPNTPYHDKISNQFIDSYGTSFNDWFKVFLGQSLPGATGLEWDEIDGVPANEAGNRIGNHLGTVDIGLILRPTPKTKLKIYRQSIYEDGSLYYLNNISDGLLGVSFSNDQGYNINIEYLDTRSQGGAFGSGNTIPELRGRDNYFNNSVYLDAWTYKKHALGLPLLNPYLENPEASGNVKPRSSTYINNNRVQAFNLKVNYPIDRHSFYTQIIASRNFGTYSHKIDLNQYSFLQGAVIRMNNGINLQGRLAGDFGEYLPNSFGLDLSVIKIW